MHFQRFLDRSIMLIMLLVLETGVFSPPQAVRAEEIQPAPPSQVSAYELILAMNTLRVSYGLPALIEDPIVNAVAQSTAATMAANNMSWHIGDVRGRIAAAGYGNGGTVWATENFAVSSGGMGIDEIMAAWADPDHMRPAVNPAYCHVGAGAAQTSDGRIYYILQAAYVSGQECGSSSPSPGGTAGPGAIPNPVSQLIIPVKIATPDAEGKIFHEVQAGQSFWSIAIAYQITIHDIEVWNNLSRNIPLRAGQRLFIPGKNTEGYATPTPFGMFVPATPDADGKIIHEVQAYQALITIADAYHVSMDRVLALNGWQEDWPLQIGQKLLIDPGHITPSPTLSNIQKLTPEADGNYYHTVRSGETLSWIAGLYEVPLADLMAWNGLNNTSVIRPEQKLVLLVTPPATATATQIPSPIAMTPSPSPSIVPSPTGTPPVTAARSTSPRGFGLSLIVGVTTLVICGWLWWRFSRKRSNDTASE
ncbi:MAG TPA: LysM peptidoglycan-binding domain-containing protein [Anaerolineales bacterium]|nr:LysM peptidoglycan-binding domain-containing protein [Anaerolineales bacterium]